MPKSKSRRKGVVRPKRVKKQREVTQARRDELRSRVLEGVEKHRAREPEAAWNIYDEVLKEDPNHPDALNFAGVLANEMNEPQLALEMLRRSLATEPNNPSALVNLGNVFVYLDEVRSSADCYIAALQLDPDHVDALVNFGFIRLYNQEAEKAVDCLEAALELEPAHPQGLANLARAWRRLGDLEKALATCRRRIAVRPDEDHGYMEAAHCLTRLGRTEEIPDLFKAWGTASPARKDGVHHFDAILEGVTPDRATDGYVSKLFDGYARSFDRSLARLGYVAPGLVHAEFLRRVGGEETTGLRVLDAGCGTGLMAPLLKPSSGWLGGVDLSAGMLQHAERRQLYDELHEAELTEFIGRFTAEFDFITCADTFCYFGRLDQALAVMLAALKPGGHCVFTVEHNVQESADYEVLFSGRYRHSAAYVRATVEACGLGEITISEEELRIEFGDPVPGLVVGAQRPA